MKKSTEKEVVPLLSPSISSISKSLAIAPPILFTVIFRIFCRLSIVFSALCVCVRVCALVNFGCERTKIKPSITADVLRLFDLIKTCAAFSPMNFKWKIITMNFKSVQLSPFYSSHGCAKFYYFIFCCCCCCSSNNFFYDALTTPKKSTLFINCISGKSTSCLSLCNRGTEMFLFFYIFRYRLRWHFWPITMNQLAQRKSNEFALKFII